jgi:hypothetical protein
MLTIAHAGALVWSWPDIIAGTLSSFGAAFFLAFTLFVFERRFVRRVTEEVRDATEAAIAEQTRQFGGRLDQLEQRLGARRAESRASQDQAVNAISDDVSFKTVTTALLEADDVGAIQDCKLSVPGSEQSPFVVVKFRYDFPQAYVGRGRVVNSGTNREFTVEIEVGKRPGEIGRPVIEAEWTARDKSEDIGAALETQLRRRDRLAEAKTFDFSLAVRELQRGLNLALETQRVPLGQEMLHGALRELVVGGWAITTAGLEKPALSLLFTNMELGFLRRAGDNDVKATVAAPPGTEQDEWDWAVHRAGQQPSQTFPY